MEHAKNIDWWECCYEKNEKGSWEKVYMGQALLLQFGIDFEELEGGIGHYSTAIIELPDGSVKNVPVENIAIRI